MISMVPAATYGTTGLAEWLQDNVITIILLVLAAAVLWAAKNGNLAKGLTIAAGLLLGVAVLGLATGNTAQDIGAFVVGLFRS
jgi:hypothetical protein